MTKDEVYARLAGCKWYEVLVIMRQLVNSGELSKDELFAYFGSTPDDLKEWRVKD